MGVDRDLVRWPLRGEVAALQVLAGIPEDIETVLDDTRGGDEWRIRLKENTLLPAFVWRARRRPNLRWRNCVHAAAIPQRHHRCRVGLSAAFEMNGAIRDRYEQGVLGAKLGALLSDEENARVRVAGATCSSEGRSTGPRRPERRSVWAMYLS